MPNKTVLGEASTVAGRSTLVELTYFMAIARRRSFRRAGLEMGISASGLSHAMKGLEARLGVRLLNRTNRSVTLTTAGQELMDAIGQPFERIGQAVEDLNRYRDAPRGRIRLNVVADAAPLLLSPVMGEFVDRYPEIEIDVVVTNRMLDVVGEGFDAGIRYGGTVPEDMVSLRLSADTRWVVAGAPAYLMTDEPTNARKSFGDIAPKLAEITDKVLFGDVWRDETLSPRDRSLVTITSLVALYRHNELGFHLKRGVENGLSKDEIVAAITHTAFYAGWPTAMTAVQVAREALKDAP